MSGDGLDAVLDALEAGADRTESPTDSAAETALVVSCSTCRSGHRGALWPADASWRVVRVGTLGNQTWRLADGDRVLDRDVAHLTAVRDIDAVLVVGHTDCTVLADAYERSVTPATDAPAGLETRLAPLVSLVEAADGLLDASTPLDTARHRLVEYNVVRQVAFLRRHLPASVTVAGYVHDQDGAYRSFPDRRYLVALDDDTEPAAIRERLSDDTVQVGRLRP